MNVYATDDEQAEAIKQWWRENGRSVVAGLVLGLGGVFGWQSWQQYQARQIIQASNSFAQIATAAEAGQADQVKQLMGYLTKAHPGSIYETLATLQLVRLRVEAGDLADATALLQGALKQDVDDSLKQVIRVRLARLLLSQDQVEAAAAVVEAAPDDAFRAEFNALRGDIALSRNQPEKARAAWRAAIDEGAGNSALLRLKLDDLGLTDDKAAG